jgi:hypothetical protein
VAILAVGPNIGLKSYREHIAVLFGDIVESTQLLLLLPAMGDLKWMELATDY